MRWQGWAVLGIYLALVFADVYYFKAQRSVVSLLVYLACLTAVFLAVVALKGERPLGWRWGHK